MLVNKKKLYDQIRNRGKKFKFEKSEKIAYVTPVFSALESSAGQMSHIVNILKDFTEKN